MSDTTPPRLRERLESRAALYQLAAADPLGALAVAVAERALIDAAAGDGAAQAWLATLRADVLAHAPERLRRRIDGELV